MPRLYNSPLLPLFVAATLTVTGCASDGSSEDSGWRPVPQPERFMSFAAGRFDLKPVTYARKQLSFNHALDYGQWRATGDSKRTVRLVFQNIRSDAYLVFTTNSRDTLPEDIESMTDSDAKISFETPFVRDTAIGQIEAVRFTTAAVSCLGIRWYEGNIDREAELRGTGRSLGTQSLTGYHCENAGHKFDETDVDAFASAISIKGFRLPRKRVENGATRTSAEFYIR